MTFHDQTVHFTYSITDKINTCIAFLALTGAQFVSLNTNTEFSLNMRGDELIFLISNTERVLIFQSKGRFAVFQFVEYTMVLSTEFRSKCRLY